MVLHKKALLIGINYIGSGSELRGCWNDIDNMEARLLKLGYTQTDITKMSDRPENRGTALFPTTSNILSALGNLVGGSVSGDQLFLHYSGHGGQIPDKNRDELDRKDECIFSCQISPIVDDQLRTVLVDALPEGVKLRCIFDCCHSGTGIDLPYLYIHNQGFVKEEPVGSTDKNVICISGCRDNQTSADAYINNSSQGALTACLLDILGSMNPNTTYEEFITELDRKVATGHYDQVPQLSVYNKQSIYHRVDI